MQLWLLLALVFIVQETISSSIVMLEAYQANYNFWLITLLFCAITVAEVVVGYYLGRWIEKRFGANRIIAKTKKKLGDFSGFIGKYGKIVGLIVVVPFLFPIDAIFLPWFEVSLAEAVAYVLIGELIFWYAYEWLIVWGIQSFIGNPRLIAAIVLLATIAIVAAMNVITKQPKKEKGVGEAER